MYNGKDYLIRKVLINKKNSFDIENENISYCSFDNYHGLQTIFQADSDEYKKIMECCDIIVKNTEIIDNILTKKAGN